MHLAYRRVTHLRGFDYRTPGGYYVTLCCSDRRMLLGEVQNGVFLPTPLGEDVSGAWQRLPSRFGSIELDVHVVMPNHFHGVVHLNDGQLSLHGVIQAFKSLTTVDAIREGRITGHPLWQRSYHEHVVRDDDDLDRIREYIVNNPLQWDLDRENPLRKGEDPFDRYMDTFKDEPGAKTVR